MTKVSCSGRALTAFMLIFFCFSGYFCFADAPGLSESGWPELSASLIVVGPNSPIYTYWGHIGIAIEDTAAGTDLFYDFGNFSFYSENFYKDFINGRMMYLGFVTPTDRFIVNYLFRNSNLTVYPLHMGQEELRILQERLKWWVSPENCEYLYDYYYQNCSTIIRDVLDEALGGALKASAEDITPYTFRYLTSTGAHENMASQLLLNYLLGAGADFPITRWQWMFLPQAVVDVGRSFTYTGKDGVERTLVGQPNPLKVVERPPVPEKPRAMWPVTLVMGLVSALLWAAARRFAGRGGFLTTAGSLIRGFIVIFVGIFGLILGIMMFLTDHMAMHHNLNFWFALPTVLAGLVPLTGLRKKGHTGRRNAELFLSWLWTANLAGLIAVVFIRITGLSIQDSFSFWLFVFPLLLTASRPGLWLDERIFGPV